MLPLGFKSLTYSFNLNYFNAIFLKFFTGCNFWLLILAYPVLVYICMGLKTRGIYFPKQRTVVGICDRRVAC
jgi:hypothetical protein